MFQMDNQNVAVTFIIVYCSIFYGVICQFNSELAYILEIHDAER